jgi:type IV secretory pathway TraG/TraD family ATPase VirD4
LEQVRAATYRSASEGTLRLPVTFVLDEVANVAPLPDLPAMVSEGGGQGLSILACLQDLSQARTRWGPAADGFFSLFGTKVLLPGIGDMMTLDAVSRLAGQADVVVRSVNSSAWWAAHPTASTTRSPRLQARLPVDEAHSLPAGTALVIAGARPPQRAYLTRWWDYPPFCDARLARLPANLTPSAAETGAAPRAATATKAGAAALPSGMPLPPPAPPSPPSSQNPEGDLTLTWRGVPGQRRLHPPPPRL